MISDDPGAQLNLSAVDPLHDKEFVVRKRDGKVELFNEARILLAIESAFKAQHGLVRHDFLSDSLQGAVKKLAATVTEAVLSQAVRGVVVEIETIQDAIETQLMKEGHFAVARRYILYRDERRKVRILRRAARAECAQDVSGFGKVQILAVPPHPSEPKATAPPPGRVEVASASDAVDALLRKLCEEALPQDPSPVPLEVLQRQHFQNYIERAVSLGWLDPRLLEFDLEFLSSALRFDRDRQFSLASLKALLPFLLRRDGASLETPQYFWMRLAMGLAMDEGAAKEARAVEFYEAISAKLFVCSTAILANSGKVHPQLNASFVGSLRNDLDHLFQVFSSDTKICRKRADVTNDWTRFSGGIPGGSDGGTIPGGGVLPFLNVANHLMTALQRSQTDRGAVAASLEIWHLEIEKLLNFSAAESARTPDIQTIFWIPDLFLKRVREDADWTLFSPEDAALLHRLHGAAFEKQYRACESAAAVGEISKFRRMRAADLWKNLLQSIIHTGQPWIAFKDSCHRRSTQTQAGTAQSVGAETEVVLDTLETTGCSTGAINLAAHLMKEGGLDHLLLSRTVSTAMRMLDNAIEATVYPDPESAGSTLSLRPVGLGLTGFQEALYRLGISWASPEAATFADCSMEAISYYAILSSCGLAEERGFYPGYHGSTWHRGILPMDSWAIAEASQVVPSGVPPGPTTQDWSIVRSALGRSGMRHCTVTAGPAVNEGSTIAGVTPSIEPATALFDIKNGEANAYLKMDLERAGLWDENLVAELVRSTDSVQRIDRVPAELKRVYQTAFEVNSEWLIETASRRQKWIDMSQCFNFYLADPDEGTLTRLFYRSWERGLKTIRQVYRRAAIENPDVIQSKPASALASEAAAVSAPAAPAGVGAILQ